MTALVQVEWFAEDDAGYPYYRSCDICFETATVEICDEGKHVDEIRQFFQEFIGGDRGIIVCERCLEDYRKYTP